MRVLFCVLLAFGRVASVEQRRAQAAEVSWDTTPCDPTGQSSVCWDDKILDCLRSPGLAYSDTALITGIQQEAMNRARVYIEGYNGRPQVYLTNEEGTVIAYQQSGPNGQGSVLLTWPETTVNGAMRAMPLEVHAKTCPPPVDGTEAATMRGWRGIYDDVAANCCAEFEATQAERALFTPSLEANWGQQRFTVSAPQKAYVLNYVRDDAGNVLGTSGNGWAGELAPREPLTTRDFTTSNGNNYLEMQPMTTGITVCAMNNETINPICARTDFQSSLLADLRSGNTNPAAFAADEVALTDAGNKDNPKAIFTWNADATNTQKKFCTLFAETEDDAFLGFAASDPGSGSVSLILDLPASGYDTVDVYGCCYVTVYGFSQGHSGNNAVRCPNSNMKTQQFSVSASRSATIQTWSTAFNTAGFGSLNDDFGAYCLVTEASPPMFPGSWFVNSTGNCTCFPNTNTVTGAKLECEKLPGFDRYLTDAQVAAFVLTGLFGGVVLIGIGVWYAKFKPPPVKKGQHGTLVQLDRITDPEGKGLGGYA